ncbi:DarT ssDNA thymidine ADP-ribosyltransferase family protein [Plantactinospora siamensis]|uniref:DarT ssDNA thymidine ADP-ribosyltransferase family protein n=1 Tax=Plantactinospora siamensis TaxID=555372 RepID=A0ABV6NRY0_9ACTN
MVFASLGRNVGCSSVPPGPPERHRDRSLTLPGSRPAAEPQGRPRRVNVPEDPDRMRRRAAELLVHREFPLELVLGYVVRTPARRAELLKHLRSAGSGRKARLFTAEHVRAAYGRLETLGLLPAMTAV